MTIIPESIDRLKAAVEPLFDGGITFKDVWTALGTLIHEAEAIYGAGQGADKHELVRAVWNELDVKYGLLDKLDEAVKLPFWIEPFDRTVMKLGIDMMISGLVAVFNQFGWGK
jgi:hypothetical protein